jgi:ABC-2 type transport system permease protein
MSKTFTLVKKELNSYFISPLGYVVISVFLVIGGWLFVQTFFLNGQASMRDFFDLLPIIFMFFLPAVTMAAWSEEKKSGTIEVLTTFPVKSSDLVLAKFISSFIFLAIMLLLTIVIPIMVTNLGTPDKGVILAGYIGSLLLGAAYIAVGLWVSSITKNQIVSFILAVVIIFGFYIIGNPFITGSLPLTLATVARFVSFSSHFNSILRGVISLSDVVYYLSAIAFFLFLNARVISLRNWK